MISGCDISRFGVGDYKYMFIACSVWEELRIYIYAMRLKEGKIVSISTLWERVWAISILKWWKN